MNLFALRKHLDRLIHPVVSALARLPLHANAWTLLGALIGLIGGVVFFYGEWWLGLGLLIVRGLVDHIDGFKARNFNQRSTFGAVMDDVCDRWVLGISYAVFCLKKKIRPLSQDRHRSLPASLSRLTFVAAVTLLTLAFTP